MKCDILVAGVGGQGILSASAVIATAALNAGLHVKQSEVHGMAQRGGAVVAHLRIADHPIHSDLIPEGTADLVLSMEPLESLRYLPYLDPTGIVVTSTDPVENIHDYPDHARLLETIRSLPRALAVPADRLARQAGSPRSANLVMAGAASHFLPLDPGALRASIQELVCRKGRAGLAANLEAFDAGRAALNPQEPDGPPAAPPLPIEPVH